MRLSDILPGWTNRAVFVGMTGSGKTTLAGRMTRFYKFAVVLDIKADLNAKDFSGFVVTTTIADLVKKGNSGKCPKILFRPDRADARINAIRETNSVVQQFFEYIYTRGNCVCLVDECAAVASGQFMPDAYFDLMQRGRSKNIMTFSLTQRPAFVPNVIFSESEDKYIFRLDLFADRKKVELFTGIDEKEIFALKKREFYHARLGEVSEKLNLQLKGK